MDIVSLLRRVLYGKRKRVGSTGRHAQGGQADDLGCFPGSASSVWWSGSSGGCKLEIGLVRVGVRR